MPAGQSDISGTITLLLQAMESGDATARDRLFSYVYPELRELAGRLLARSRAGRWEDATSLVGNACARLLGDGPISAQNRRHFYFLFGRALHDSLVATARSATAEKRGGGRPSVALPDLIGSDAAERVDVLALHEAIETLRAVDRDAAQVIELRFFSGRSLEETAAIMECSVATIGRHWAYGRAWLRDRLLAESEGSPGPSGSDSAIR